MLDNKVAALSGPPSLPDQNHALLNLGDHGLAKFSRRLSILGICGIGETVYPQKHRKGEENDQNQSFLHDYPPSH
jgi:hypothetical protein